MRFSKIYYSILCYSLLLQPKQLYAQGIMKDYYEKNKKVSWKLGMRPTEKGWRKDRNDGIFKDFDMVWRQKENLYVVKKLRKTSPTKFDLSAWLVDKQGKKISKTFTDIGDFSEGLAEVSYHGKCQSCFPERYDFVEINTNTHGFINFEGKEVIDLKYRRIETKFSEGKASVGYWSSDVFFIDKTGKPLFNKIFKSTGSFHNGIADVELKDGSVNYINSNGGLLIPKFYLFIRPYEKNTIRAFKSLSGKIGFWNDKNEPLLEAVYDDFDYEIWPGKILIKQSNKFGFIDCKSGKLLISVNYDDVRTARSNQFIWMKTGKKWLKIDINHEINSEIVADEVKTIGENSLLYSLNKQWGLADSSGKILKIAEFDYVEPQLSENKMAVLKKGKYGYLDSSGNLIIPPIYDKISRFSKGEVQGTKGNYVYNLDVKNTVLSKSLSSSMIMKIFLGSGGAFILIGIFFLFRYRV